MSCEILDSTRLELLRLGRLPSDERALIARHLAEMCETCDERIGQLPSSVYLELLGGSAATLTPAESQRLKTAVLPPARARHQWLWALAGVAVALVLALVWPRPPPAWDGLKGGGEGAVRWSLQVGTRGAVGPVIERSWVSGATLAPGELLVLRVAVERSALVQAFAVAPGESPEDLWAAAEGGRHLEPGLVDLAEGGVLLALDPAQARAGTKLWVVASPEPIHLSSATALGECARCTFDVVEIRAK
jgi:hypothetical protein